MGKYTGLEVAVIGMSGRFPEADSIDQYWENLVEGKNCISSFSEEEVLEEGELDELVRNPSYVRSNAYYKNKDNFDSGLFNYLPDEAELMDPQVRIYHECCWEALEDSGYASLKSEHKIGVFAAGTSNPRWMLHSALKNRDGRVDEFTASHLRDVSFLSSRIAYKFNLRGPAVYMQSACSSSLVTIHEACNSLLLGECKMALAGGVSIQNYSKKGYLYQEGMIQSRDGNCKPFDIDSSGTVAGEGAGVVVLKKLKDAIKDGDNIYAIVKGTAINNDGNNKVGYTAPSVKGQAEVINKALKMARVEPNSIGYVEAHGTATELGDPIEIEALNKVYQFEGDGSCAIGSVKSNIGHLDAAAGVAGFIKTVLSIKNKTIPASLHFTESNTKIDFENGPFYVNNKLNQWNSELPLRAGVSSFGIGGTNAHIVLEEAPNEEVVSESRKEQLIVLSAKTQESLDEQSRELAAYLEKNENINLSDVSYTLQTGRERFKFRKVLACDSLAEGAQILTNDQATQSVARNLQEDLQNKVFMFSGQGSQYIDMCKDLYATESFFKETIDNCLSIASKYSQENFRSILFPTSTDSNSGKNINDTKYTQPLLFMVEYSLGQLLMKWGVKPDYMIGHSIGEYTAACLSGVFSLSDALRLVIRRGELMGGLEQGSMLSVSLPQQELEALIEVENNVDLAVINGEGTLVVAGTHAAIQAFEGQLTASEIPFKAVHTSHAFHSRMMDDILEQFEEEVKQVTINAPSIPYVSNVTGNLVDIELISNASYWSNHLRSTVDFKKGTETLLKLGDAIFIEVGPGRTLTNLVSKNGKFGERHTVVNSVRHPKQQVNDQKYLLEKLGQLWLNGLSIDWKAYYENETRRKVSLPTYAFAKTKYTSIFNVNELLSSRGAAIGRSTSDFINKAGWKITESPNSPVKLDIQAKTFLVFSDTKGVMSSALKGKLISDGAAVITVGESSDFTQINEAEFQLDMLNQDHFSQLWNVLSKNNISVSNIVFLQGFEPENSALEYENIDAGLSGYLALSFLGKSIGDSSQKNEISIAVVANQVLQVNRMDALNPLKSTILAPVKIIPSEMSTVSTKLIDVEYSDDSEVIDAYAALVVNEVLCDDDQPLVAYRHFEKWIQNFERISSSKEVKSEVSIIENGNYLVTGGFGGMGFSIAKSIVLDHNANVILMYRSDFPKREDWDNWIDTNSTQNATSEKIESIRLMEATGCTVELVQLDVSKEESVKEELNRLKAKYENLNGLIWASGEVDNGGIIQNRETESLTKYLKSKVHGVLLFNKYMDFGSLDFVSLFSSIGNIFYQHKFGQVAYNAANEFMESYANHLQKKSKVHAFSINWCDWLNVGMTYKIKQEQLATEDASAINATIDDAIYPDQGVSIFHTCLQNKPTNWSIHKSDLVEAIQWYKENLNELQANLEISSDSITDVVSDENIETALIEVFCEYFGNDTITSADDFFELGGDSLKAMTLVGRINKGLGVQLAIGDIYKWPNIKSLAAELKNTSNESSYQTIPTASIQSSYPLSFAQKGMYFLQMLSEESVAYNEPKGLRIKGEFNAEKAESILKNLIIKHESLRTQFILDGESPKQVVVDDFEFKINEISVLEEGIEDAIKAFVRPFNLSEAPLFRVGLIQVNQVEQILLIDSHHIVMDGQSKAILISEFKRLYDGETVEENSITYKDYSYWQQSSEKQADVNEQKKFWIDSFENLPESNELPLDFNRPDIQDDEGDIFTAEIGKDETDMLRSIASDAGTTMFNVLIAVLCLELSKLVKEEDVIIGTPTAGRQHADLENVIGMFVSVLAMRNLPSGDLTFSQFLENVNENTLACFKNQEYPFESLVDDLNLTRDIGRNPLFDVLFAYEKSYKTENNEGLAFIEESPSRISSRNDIALSAVDSEDGIQLNFVYSKSLYRRASMERFATYFKQIVSTIVNKSSILLSDIEIISNDEKNIVVNEFNNTDVILHNHKPVIDLFFNQALKTPNNKALVIGNETISYLELTQRVNSMAQKISENTNTDKPRVALLIDVSIEMAVSMLAVLRTGGSYIPLSTEAPIDRNKFIIKDSHAELLIVDENLLDEHLVANIGMTSSEILPSISEVVEELEYTVKPIFLEDTAYIIYTSGTTGEPKGVKVLHSGLTNYSLWKIGIHDFTEEDTSLQIVSYHFDGFCANFYPMLLSGGAMALVSNEYKLDTHMMASIIEKHRTSYFAILPGIYGVLLDEIEKIKDTSFIREVVLAGEKSSEGLVSKSKRILPNISLGNEYGPTETTIAATFNKELTENTAVIGTPIWNTSIYILDKSGRVQPIGVEGEMYVAGFGIAKGYINNPELTDEKFIANPFDESGKSKLYRTGDIARWMSDGKIEYLGRIDNQVKIRGFRIELGEIENGLSNYSDINQVVVVVKERGDNKLLVAYYVSENELKTQDLKVHLSASLPDYMVPSHYVRMASIPLTINGKVDRKGLPEFDMSVQIENTVPTTKEEMLLAEVWSSVLGIEKIGITDNFFSIGGDSIKSIQISSRMRNAGYELAVKDIFTSQTIQELALKLKSLSRTSDQSEVIGEVTLSPIQQWFFEGSISEKHHFNQSVMLNFSEGIYREVVERIFAKIQEHHDALRITFSFTESGISQKANGIDFPLDITENDLRGNAQAEEELTSSADALQGSIDISNGPLMKLGLYHLEDGSRLLMVFHHLVIDGISWRILFEDIEQLYQQIGNNETLSLPLKTDAFKLWTEELVNYQTSKQFEDSVTYWEANSNFNNKALPHDFQDGTNTFEDLKRTSIHLSEDETEKLLTSVHKPFNTQVNDILLNALLLTVNKQYGLDSIAVDLEGHGREDLGNEMNISRTIGWFTSIYPVVLSKATSELSQLIIAQKEALRRIPNNGLDYLMYSQSNENGSLKKPSISFNYLGQFDSDLEGKVYSVSSLNRGNEISLKSEREYDWDFGGIVSNGKLEFSLAYSEKQYKETSVESFMDSYKSCLIELIQYCDEYEGQKLTPSDLTYKGLSIPQLDALQEKEELKDLYTLSPMQEGMLFQALVNPDSSDNFLQMSYHIEGDLDIEAVEASMNDLMVRFDVLRTVFISDGYEKLLQMVLTERKIEFNYKDIQEECEEASLDEIMEAYQVADRTNTFNLESDVLMRLSVFKSGAETYEFIWSCHHILMDGWCMGIIINEFTQLYTGRLKGIAVELPVTVPYSSYIKWLNERDSSISESYWKDYLTGYNKISTLPRSVEETHDLPFEQAHHHLVFNEKETTNLNTLIRDERVTLTNLMHTAWGILLQQFSNGTDVVFGSVVSGRPTEVDGVENMVGLFINTVPVRLQIKGGTTFSDLLGQVHNQALESEEHHYHPLSEIQMLSELGRDVFDHFMVVENYPIPEEISSEEGEEKSFKASTRSVYEKNENNLSLCIYPDDELKVSFIYNLNHYSKAFIEQVSGYLNKIIASIIADSSVEVSSLKLVSDNDKSDVFNEIDSYDQEKMTAMPLIPASYHQERMWFIDKFESGYLYDAGPVYHNIPLIVEMKGAVDTSILEKSITAIINKHDILRTSIITIEERSYQQINPSHGINLNLVQESNGDAFIQSEIDRAFELDSELMRASLITREEGDHVLLMVFHHILVDRHSVVRLSEELLTNYKKLQAGEELNGSDNSLQYAGFSLWQQISLQKIEFDFVGYWKTKLEKVKALEIQTDRPRAAVHSYTSDSVSVQLPTSIVSQLMKYASQNDVEMNVLLMAAFKLLLFKYTQQEEIFIGTSVNNRTEKLADMIGPMANLIVVKSELTSSSNFNEYVSELDRVCESGEAYNAMPFDKLVKELAPKRDMSRTALFDVLYQYEENNSRLPDIEDLETSIVETNLGYGKYDLNLFLQRTNDTIDGQLVFNSEYFDKSTIEVFVKHYYQLLESALASPSTPFSDLNVLNTDEEGELLNMLNHEAVAYPKDKTILDLFAEQVSQTPTATAVQYEQEALSYEELDRRSTQVGILLRTKGVKRDDVIGLLMDRTLDTVIGILGILKAGGACLPIDVDYPAERKQYILEDSKTQLVLTSDGVDLSILGSAVSVVKIEEALEITESVNDFEYVNMPSDLCYIIYASGTTRNPKGVMIEHGNIVRLFNNDSFQFNFGTEDVWTMFHNHSFDFSVWEMYGALLFGGKLVVIPNAIAKDADAYLNVLRTEGVTVLNQAPSEFYNLIEQEARSSSKLNLRYVILGGEVLSPSKLSDWHAKYPEVELVNMFGITEATVHATYKFIRKQEIESGKSNIGLPIPTLSAYVLDENQRLVPRGAVGELYIGGAGVSRGYLGKEELTSERFVANPFKENDRLFRSGNLTRITTEGELEYIGRIDHQVQLGGFRFELSEIESQLSTYPEIDQVAVVVKGEEEGKKLIAYYSSEDAFNGVDLKNHLLELLPDYMVPSMYFQLDKMPLTSKGKVDKKALPEFEIKADEAHVDADSDVQQKLVEIWSSLLNIPKGSIGIYSNFFELGGHSINLIKLRNEVNGHFDCEISMANMFRLPTIKDIEEFILVGDTDIEEMSNSIEEAQNEAEDNLSLITGFID